MANPKLSTSAFLQTADQRIPVHARYASRYSLWIKFLQDREFSCDESFTLIIPNNGDCLEMGPCRLIPDPAADGHDGRLIFLKDVYDINSLLSQNRVVKLQAPFYDLPLLLARKELIKKPFKEYVTNLAYDLHVYKKLFDELDLKCRAEPEDIQPQLQQAVIETEGPNFRHFFHSSVRELDRIVADYRREEHQLHGAYLRKQLWNFIRICPLYARSNLKPRGYAGDSQMMRMIYLNAYQGDSTFSKLMQKYSVGTPAAESVRNRRTVILESLLKFNNRIQLPPQEKIRILSVACGSAWELKDILASTSDIEKYDFTLLDQDPLALKEASQIIDEIEKKSDAKVQVDYVEASVRTMIAKKSFKKKMRTYHFIYSMGLFDYLSTPVAKRVIEKLYQLLTPAGEMVVGNFHESNSSRNLMEYWGDWSLIHRTEDELRNLLPPACATSVSVIFEDTGNQMFLYVKKEAKVS